jgi:hypothetical protein
MALVAVKSVLRQDFKDFEVVVSDNSSPRPAEQLQAAVVGLADPRVVYVRPSAELSMGEHWEFALQHSVGEYVGYLTDRMAFKRTALAKLHEEISTHRAEVMSYSSSGLMEEAPPFRLQRPPFTGRAETYETAWVVKVFSLSIHPWGAPNMLNSIASRRVLNGMSATYPDLMASAVAPDVSFGMHVLDHLDHFDYLDEPLMLSYGNASSNGAALNAGRTNDAAQDFLARMERLGGLLYAPIPSIIANCNIIAHEYCRMKAHQKSGRFTELDLVRYCRSLSAELEQRGKLADADRRRLDAFINEHGLSRTAPAALGSQLERALRSPRTKSVMRPVMQVASDWLGINPTNRPVGRFEGIEDALDYDEAHPAQPNTRESGFIRARDRIELAAAGVLHS